MDLCVLVGVSDKGTFYLHICSYFVEAFCNMVHRAERRGELQDVAVAQHAPRISHLLFADDTLIFSQASEEALGASRGFSSSWSKLSGLKINLDKLAMCFSRNVPQAHHTSLATILGVQGGEIRKVPRSSNNDGEI
ncbi:UNVERIFIED_CONTAM: hypothetical protein Slati_3695900 [Sesamum latifolium]|uniref:Reverse transcriptase domain-containing protein n=1 Tax=Sesamum latifolium TaxID=2727402 RepID=A0AAW2U2X5_9LAMI